MAREAAVWVGILLWLGAVVGGFWAWERYDATPGAAAAPADQPPVPGAEWSLVMFVHPHCPCSRASLAELAELLREAPPGVDVSVVFVRPPGVPAGWERGELWDDAGQLPGVRLRVDDGGAEAERAGAAASGHAVLYDRSGRAVFAGGLTPGRGRRGESAGRYAVLALLKGGTADDRAAVFGCPLGNPGACPVEGGGACPR